MRALWLIPAAILAACTVDDSLIVERKDDSVTVRIVDGDTAILYKTATATGPAWTTSLPPRFSCGSCVRDVSPPDAFELIACASVIVEGAATPRCAWF